MGLSANLELGEVQVSLGQHTQAVHMSSWHEGLIQCV